MGRETSCRLVRVQSTMQILVALTEEVAESIMDHTADSLAWIISILICQVPDTGSIRYTDSIFNESYIMAKLKVKETGRNWWNRRSRRDIYVNGKHSGVLTGEEVEIEVEPGPCKVTVQNVFPAFRSTAYINIEEKASNHVDFRDTKWFLNFMMAVNVGLIFLRGLIPMPQIVRKVSNIYTYVWIMFSLFNRNGYFKTFAYSRVAICDPEHS